jgi:PTH2 family peptidyl-tRNA hydrolase
VNDIKQVIIIRKDLHMRMGKIAAQCSHASMKIFFDRIIDYEDDEDSEVKSTIMLLGDITPEMKEWLGGLFTKIVVYVNSEQELLDIYNKSKEENIICSLIKDSGLTEFHEVQTYTCCAIGPDQSEKIDIITGHLPLL